MEYERFEINLAGDKLTISAQEDETYIIYRDDHRMGVISPEWQGDELVWVSTDLISADYARQIGELIQEHDM